MNLTFNQSISSFFPREMAIPAIKRGVDLNAVLEKSRISKGVLESEHARISPQHFADFINEVIRNSKDEFICLGEKRVLMGHFKLMSELCYSANTLHDIYKKMIRFYLMTIDWLKIEFIEDTKEVEIRFYWPNMTHAMHEKILMEIILIQWHRFPSWMIDSLIPINNIFVAHSTPPYNKEYKLMYPCEVIYNSSHYSLVVPKSYLQKPNVRELDDIIAYVKKAPLDWFVKQQYSPKHTKKILEIFHTSPSNYDLSIESIASLLNMTSRTLRRRLLQENTSFSEIKDNFRRDLAIKLLDNNKKIENIAEILGYSETAAFSRAFKKWTGLSPKKY